MPLPPGIFIGRDEFVNNAVSLIKAEAASRLAILGPGGMGKTAAALHILHHRDIIGLYHGHRYYVACEAVNAAYILATSILQVLNVKQNAIGDSMSILKQHLALFPPMLLVLDNFEIPWGHNQTAAEEVLGIIAAVKHVSLVITMDATVHPSGIWWTQALCLSPLSLDASRSLYLTMNPVPLGNDPLASEHLDLLMEELAYIPLAIHLVANMGQELSCQDMLAKWNEEKTVMLHSSNSEQLDSLDVSIHLSLKSSIVTENPDAIQLLSIICHLPDGLLQWQERLTLITVGFQNVHQSLDVLLRAALVFDDNGVLKVLAPIRHYIHLNHPTEIGHLMYLENFYFKLISQYAGEPTFSAAKYILPEVGNISSLIKYAIQHHPQLDIVDAALGMSKFLHKTQPSTHLLDDVHSYLKESGLTDKEAALHLLKGCILFKQDRHNEARGNLLKAQHQFFSIGNQLGEAQSLKVLGNVLCVESRYDEARETLIKAQQKFFNIGSTLGAAQCSRSLGDVLCDQNDYVLATEKFMEAQKEFLQSGDQLGAAQCLQQLSTVLYVQGQYEKAKEASTDAQKQFTHMGSHLEAAQCSKTLGDILHKQNKHDEAREAFIQAQSQFVCIGDQLGAVQCLYALGNILRIQGKYNDARDTFTEAQQQFCQIGDMLGLAQCLQGSGDILRMQHKHDEAIDALTKAQQKFVELQEHLRAAQCLRSLGDTLRMQSRYDEAIKHLVEAQQQFLQIGHQLGAAQCLRILGTTLRMQCRYDEAREVLTEAKQKFIQIGDEHGIDQCSKSLCKISHRLTM